MDGCSPFSDFLDEGWDLRLATIVFPSLTSGKFAAILHVIINLKTYDQQWGPVADKSIGL